MTWICRECEHPCGVDLNLKNVSDAFATVRYCPMTGGKAKWELEADNEFDNVNHPAHYTEGRKYEPIEVIEDWELDFCLGNALKYISRAGRKNDTVEDLNKAIWYIQRKIEQLEGKE